VSRKDNNTTAVDFKDIPEARPSNSYLKRHARKEWKRRIDEFEAIPFSDHDVHGEERNNRFFQLVCRLASYIPPPWQSWDAEKIRKALSPTAPLRGIAGWEATMESAIRTGQSDPAKLPPGLSAKSDEETLRNYRFELDESDPEKEKWIKSVKPAHEIVAQVHAVTGEWPRTVDGRLFARTADGDKVWWIKDAPDLVAWLDQYFAISWASRLRGDAPISKAELVSALANRSAHEYDAIELLPHHPPLDGVYYLSRISRDGDGSALSAFAALLNPETELDRRLMVAALLTPMWGGPAGGRPAFVFRSRFGRGSGKTATVQAICEVYGSYIDIAPRGAQWYRVQERLLARSGLEKRCVLIDNIKGRLDLPELDAAITSKWINGHRLHYGDARRPNHLTWFLTANTPSLSADLAARAVVVHVGPPQHQTDFHGRIRAFLEQHHDDLLADIITTLRRPRTLREYSADRFQAWQSAILGCFDAPEAMAELVTARRSDVDDDTAIAVEIRAAFEAWIANREGSPDPDSWVGGIPTAALQGILGQIHPDVTKSPQSLWRWLGEYLGSGPLSHCHRATSGHERRLAGCAGVLWGSQ
jgi:hypothetical protein